LKLFDGERSAFTVWLINTGRLDIGICELKFSENLQAEIAPIVLPIRVSDSRPVNMIIPIRASLKEIGLTITCAASGIRSIMKLVQPVSVASALSITSIEPVISLTELAFYQTELIFLAVGITNHSNATFRYRAAFRESAHKLPGILTELPDEGVFVGFETAVFILAVEKTKLLASADSVPRNRVMAAVKGEEEKIGHKVDKVSRAELVKRLGIITFVERNLDFEWRVGNGRSGRLTQDSALPTPETLVEVLLHRPRMAYQFVGLQGNRVECFERVELRLNYEDAVVTECQLDLGLYFDPGYGIAWDGTLDGIQQAPGQFGFALLFTKPGKFDFRVQYLTVDGVTGGHRLTVDVNGDE
jgi:hypothetical protein